MDLQKAIAQLYFIPDVNEGLIFINTWNNDVLIWQNINSNFTFNAVFSQHSFNCIIAKLIHQRVYIDVSYACIALLRSCFSCQLNMFTVSITLLLLHW